MLKVLEADFARLPQLLGRGAPERVPEVPPLVLPAFDERPVAEPDAVQLGLF